MGQGEGCLGFLDSPAIWIWFQEVSRIAVFYRLISKKIKFPFVVKELSSTLKENINKTANTIAREKPVAARRGWGAGSARRGGPSAVPAAPGAAAQPARTAPSCTEPALMIPSLSDTKVEGYNFYFFFFFKTPEE